MDFSHGPARAGSSGARTRRTRLAVLGVAVGTAFAAAAVVSPAHPVQAASAPHAGVIVGQDPDDHTPHVLDGYVRTFAEVGNTVLVGGNFTTARSAASDAIVQRNYVFAFDRTTGEITPFAPALNGEVYQVLPTGDGQTVFVAGGFSSVNGRTVRGLVRLDVSTGERVTSFVPPAFGGRIHDMALRNGRLYLTGRFLTVAGRPRTLLAAVDPVTGANIPEVDVTFSEPRSGGSLTIYASDLSPDGSSLIAVGNFTKVNGESRYQIAKIDLTTPTPTVAHWNTKRYGDGCSTSFDSYMRDVAYSPDGSYFAVVTTGAYSSTFLCDAVARFDNDSTSLAAEPVWTNYTGGDTITAVAVTDAAVYTGGHYGWMNNPYASDSIGNGAVVREGLSALDPRSGAVLSWNPTRTLGWGVYGFAATDTGLWIGSDTDRIGTQEYHGRMAFMPLAAGAARVDDFGGVLPGQTVTVATDGATVRTRQFTGTSVVSSATATQNWTGLRGAFMLNGKLYTAWSNKTFRVQTYDGSTFGPQSAIPMTLVTSANPGGPGDPAASVNRFSTQDLAGMTAMFYEPLTGRIYFTRANENRLYYRSFSQETNIVGAERQDGIAGFVGLDWRTVRGMFLVDGRLYVADTGGALTRWDWDPKGGPADLSNLSPAAYSGRPVAGTSTVVSGPVVDGNNWNGLATFLSASSAAPNLPPVAAVTHECTDNRCEFDGSASADTDGSIATYVWDFGDATTPGVGPAATHSYGAGGTYTATLTVVDDRGARGVTQFQVSVTMANQSPTADFAAVCTGLSCSVDAAGSHDADGTIATYAWNFGDGATATGLTATHDYPAAGTYTVSLTVTDDRQSANTTSQQVTVVDPAYVATVSFVGANGTSTNSATPSVLVPSEVVEGDTLVLLGTSASISTATTPEGWTPVHSAVNDAGGIKTYLWTRTATAADAGTRVAVAQSSLAKMALQIVAYRGASGVESFSQAFDSAQRSVRTTPPVDVPAPGSMVLSYWADKSSATTAWALPAEVTLRNQAVGSGSGRVVAAVGDTGPLEPGPAGGYAASSDSSNTRGVVWSIVLATDLGTPDSPPSAAFTATCQNLTCSVDAGASLDVEGPIADYLWDFGDGTGGTGVTAEHTYAAAGTFAVTLTVVDDQGQTALTTREVVVAEPPAAVVAHRASVGIATTGGNPRVIVPPEVAAGDVMVMITTVNSTNPAVTSPPGWTALGGVNHATAGVQTFAWWKVATQADAGRSVGPNLSQTAKTTLQLSAYSGASGVAASAYNVDTTASAVRTTPIVPVAAGGSALVSYWADKSSATTTWTVPPGVALRQLTVGSGSGRIVSALADSGSLAAGTAGGLKATSDSAPSRGIVWSVVVAPA